MSLFRSACTVGGLTFLSRITGYARDVLIAAMVGAGPIAEAFFVAFRLPNLFRQLFAEGAFNSAFVPLYTQIRERDGAASAHAFVVRVFTLMTLFLLGFSALMMLCMPWVMIGFAPGFLDQPEQFQLAVVLTQITFPYLACVTLVALLGGVLNALGRFFVAAGAPVLMNLTMLVGVPLLLPLVPNPAHALAWSVTLSGLTQLLWLLYASWKMGVLPRFSRVGLFSASVWLLLRRMVPGILGGGVMQLNVWINTIIATMLPGAVAYLYYADRLVQLPLAVIGTALGTVLLPLLSRQIKNANPTAALETQHRAVRISMLLTLPSAAALLALAEPMVSVLFERGAFTAVESHATAAAIVAYSFGLPAFVLVKIYAPMFFASGDTRTPVWIAVICLIANVLLNLGLMHSFAHVGLAASTAFSSWLNVMLLAFLLQRRGLFSLPRTLCLSLVRLVIAAVFMFAVLYGWQFWLPASGVLSLASRLLWLSGALLAGGVSYFLSVWGLRAYPLSSLSFSSKGSVNEPLN